MGEVGPGIWGLLITIAGIVGASLATMHGMKTANQAVMKQAAEGWQALAEVKSAELDDVEERLKNAESQIEEIKTKYTQTLELNLQLQRDNMALKNENIAFKAAADEAKTTKEEAARLRVEVEVLRARVTELERERRDGPK